MRHLDTLEDILGYDQNYGCMVENAEPLRLSIPQGNLRLLLLNYSDDPSLLTHLKELARVYELVRQGRV